MFRGWICEDVGQTHPGGRGGLIAGTGRVQTQGPQPAHTRTLQLAACTAQIAQGHAAGRRGGQEAEEEDGGELGHGKESYTARRGRCAGEEFAMMNNCSMQGGLQGWQHADMPGGARYLSSRSLPGTSRVLGPWSCGNERGTARVYHLI